MNDSPRYYTLREVIKLLKSRKLSHLELYADILNAIKKDNKNLNIFLTVDWNSVSESEILTNYPLAGIPLAIKDNFLTINLKTTAASKILRDFKPVYESTVTRRLKEAGGVILGKTNMDAWAHGSSTETSDFGTTRNARNPAYSPGGSSGGSASAIAGNYSIAAIGSETAGSIRLPASWCGVVGLKPTYGRVSRWGVVAMGSSLDSPGPICKTVTDAGLLLGFIAGKDPYDATTARYSVPDYIANINNGVKNYKIGICYTDHPQIKGSIVDQSVRKAGELFESLGAGVDLIPVSDDIKPNTILNPDLAIAVYTVVQRSEVSSNLARYDGYRYGERRSLFGNEAKRRILLGTFTLSKGYAKKYYHRAIYVRNLYIQNFRELFQKYDLLISTPSPGFALPVGSSKDNPMFGELMDMLVEPSSLAGITGISVPCFRDKKTNLYLGLNIMADQFNEEKILRAAYAYEQATRWNEWALLEIKHGII